MSKSQFFFLALSLAGAYMMLLSPASQKISVWIADVHKAGVFPHGAPVRTVFTGTPLDLGLKFLTTFFMQFVDGSDKDQRMFALYFMYAGVMPCLALWEIEATRRGAEGRKIRYPLPWNLGVQTLGFCTIAPIYFLTHSSAASELQHATMPLPRHRAAAILPALILGYVVPTVGMFLPSSIVSPESRQALIALWQFFPLSFWVFQNALSRFYKREGSDLAALNRVYNFCMLLGAATHVYLIGYVLRSPLPWDTLAKMLRPDCDPKTLAGAAFMIIQCDFWIGVLASLVWTGGQVCTAVKAEGRKAVGLALGMGIAAVLLSPGVVMAAGFKWREEKLREGAPGKKRV